MATVQDPYIDANGQVVMRTRETTPEEDNEQANLANLAEDSNIVTNLRTVAGGTGTFANNTARDAAIRTCARGILLILRILLRRHDGTD